MKLWLFYACGFLAIAIMTVVYLSVRPRQSLPPGVCHPGEGALVWDSSQVAPRLFVCQTNVWEEP